MPTETMQSGGPSYRPDATWWLPLPLRRLLLLTPPLALAVLEVFHPNPDHTVQALLDASAWFAWFHVIQLVLTGLVALSVLLLAADYGRANAWTTRLGIGVFLLFFSSYDTLAGIGTGLAMHTARGLPAAQQEGVFAVVEDWPGLGPVFALSIVGTPGWVVAVGALALAARRLGASRPEWIALALAAVFLLGGHPFPLGTLAFGSLFVAAAVHEWAPTSRKSDNKREGRLRRVTRTSNSGLQRACSWNPGASCCATARRGGNSCRGSGRQSSFVAHSSSDSSWPP